MQPQWTGLIKLNFRMGHFHGMSTLTLIPQQTQRDWRISLSLENL